MRYNWDEAKNRRNIALHGLAFKDAARIFEGPTVERSDDRFDYGERRVYERRHYWRSIEEMGA